jgi:hypothetical protein
MTSRLVRGINAFNSYRCGVQKIGWAPVVIFEGIFAFVDEVKEYI